MMWLVEHPLNSTALIWCGWWSTPIPSTDMVVLLEHPITPSTDMVLLVEHPLALIWCGWWSTP